MADPGGKQQFLVQILDVRTSLSVDDGELANRLRQRLSFFLEPVDSLPEAPSIVAELHGKQPRLVLAGRSATLNPNAAREQAFGLIFRHLLDQVEAYFLIHAACLTDTRSGLLVAGPSGSGKTTLSLALVERGLGLLSDDFAPLDRQTGLVHPFPKALGVRVGAATELADALELPEAKPETAASSTPMEPVRIGAMVFISPDGRPPDPRRPYDYVLEGTDFDDALASFAAQQTGLAVIDHSSNELVLHVEANSDGHQALESVLALAGRRVLEHGHRRRAPHGTRASAVVAMDRSDALVLILRELQNRRPESRLMQSVGANPVVLLQQLGDQLRNCRFGWIDAGTPRDTAEQIERFLRAT